MVRKTGYRFTFFKVLSILLLLTFQFKLQSQDLNSLFQVRDYFQSYSLTVEPNRTYEFEVDNPFNALSIKLPANQSVETSSISLSDITYSLDIDPHSEGDDIFSGLITHKEPVQRFILNSGDLSGEIEIHLINGLKPKNKTSRSSDSNLRIENCDQPPIILQSTWRQGLTLPNTSRSFSTVKHLIIHHSAGSNTSNDWESVVRAIFIFHTESRGWSDIGYNYLVAPDGTLFAGRDPVGRDQDRVIGAHFCGKNTGTMGVCMMGTYTTVPPTDQSLATLKSLLAWKANLDNLDPLGQSTHSGSPLPHIAGHRDGCSTECPGQMTYDMMSSIRLDVNELLVPCGSSTEPPEPAVLFTVFPNPVSGESFFIETPYNYDEVSILDSKGRKTNLHTVTLGEELLEVPVNNLENGIYYIVFQDYTTSLVSKIVVLR